jgi:UDP-glucose:(galactosyl)LPS alpha-1,2-glucosyltransferase
MATRSKIIPIAFAFNDAYTETAAASLTSLLRTKRETTFYDIFILHCDTLCLETRKSLECFYNKRYSNFKFNWTYVNKEKLERFPLCKMSVETYFRLLIPDLLPQYDKVLWADCDFVFLKDVSEYYDRDIGDNEVAMPRDIINKKEFCIAHAFHPEIQSAYIYTSCFMVINAKVWREQNFTDQLAQTALKYYDKIKLCDLDILNLTCQKILDLPFRSAVLVGYLNGEYSSQTPGCPYPAEEVAAGIKDPSIIHYAGLENPKPWKDKNPFQPKYKTWIDNIRKSPFSKSYSFWREIACKRKALSKAIKTRLRGKSSK